MRSTYNKSRIAILSYILNMATKHYYGTEHQARVDAKEGFHGGYSADGPPPVGSLCVLMAAPDTKWYMSWLEEVKLADHGWHNYLLRSIDDGSLCWWNNIALKWYPNAETFPTWRWTDRQFEFKDKWIRATKKENDYFTIPNLPVFHPDGSVTISTRRHIFTTALGDEGYSPSKTFPSWKKVKSAEMVDFYKYAVSSIPEKPSVTTL